MERAEVVCEMNPFVLPPNQAFLTGPPEPPLCQVILASRIGIISAEMSNPQDSELLKNSVFFSLYP